MQKVRDWAWELFVFGVKEARASVFAGAFFVILFASNYLPLFGLARYDFIFVAAVLLQIALFLTRVETWDEVKVIFLFHLIGFALEVFKTHPAIGSWSYPEDGFFKIAGVPLFSGFMYAAVGSYIAQAWRVLRLELVGHPSYRWSVVLCAAIYLNFFTKHFVPDIRIVLIPAVVLFYARTWVTFVVTENRRWMPLPLGFCLIAFFIWVAENISTFYGAWKYPGQVHAWEVVSLHKITSWFLLVIVCFIVVAWLKHFKEQRYKQTPRNLD